MEFVVNKMALVQVVSEYFDFTCQLSFHRLLHIHHLSSGAGTIGQIVADVPSGLSLTPLREIKKIKVPYYLLLHIRNWRFSKVSKSKLSYITRISIPATCETHFQLHYSNVDKYVCGKLQYFLLNL
jgi:hypothetical protein